MAGDKTDMSSFRPLAGLMVCRHELIGYLCENPYWFSSPRGADGLSTGMARIELVGKDKFSSPRGADGLSTYNREERGTTVSK